MRQNVYKVVSSELTILYVERHDRILECLVDTEDVPLLQQYQWCAVPARSKWRLQARLTCRATVYMPEVLGISHADHINRNPLDNRKCNLRRATNAENNRNKGPQKNNKSGYKGVSWHTASQKWTAAIKIPDGKYLNLGLFLTAEDAAKAYNEAAVRYHGPYAYQNQVGEGS